MPFRRRMRMIFRMRMRLRMMLENGPKSRISALNGFYRYECNFIATFSSLYAFIYRSSIIFLRVQQYQSKTEYPAFMVGIPSFYIMPFRSRFDKQAVFSKMVHPILKIQKTQAWRLRLHAGPPSYPVIVWRGNCCPLAFVAVKYVI